MLLFHFLRNIGDYGLEVNICTFVVLVELFDCYKNNSLTLGWIFFTSWLSSWYNFYFRELAQYWPYSPQFNLFLST